MLRKIHDNNRQDVLRRAREQKLKNLRFKRARETRYGIIISLQPRRLCFLLDCH